MKELIYEQIKFASTVEDVRQSVVRLLGKLRLKDDVERIGYVSGIITSGGSIEENIQRLIAHTDRLRTIHNFPIFTPPDVFPDDVFERTNAINHPSEKWIEFWRTILESGHVTDIFMTPRWQLSRGATDEHETAQRIGITIHYVEEE
ncbi:MAG: hypothetical protein UU81_C0002G0027 [Microgenomates group bacterium GW2011_GWC1_41_8]|uniref:Uncharacterized protein n=2 Tax=Candidatus Roizmaniibacteriota TaxID=1752723 RepID=A0A0G0WBI1_9BACT|nr:MAG: hypothetical protein UT85_C0001G0009 [Candidatus Levybacteria bacterium GW2011_GWA2_40_16]KKR72577.1 MAG: hypothetical protein UU14_C0004G0008 [Candidatus Roizmanbacteria bacterium GW2011_GWB1_40_7]KKR95018.1 MAG: hypothetical protein UU41_C0001G0008 [Candidatus Roizmanbacteria bacterium GW2011_GWA1_41_13]KKS24772.1 MAG: hypothetical protein UU81_C0002G0027 [Microgenomates group bacterium GW2011_GWC1_41_8]OGK49059.1 MAG: hypothetical protein A3A55_00045 [Candidatus Roizmanbacteria bacte